MTLALLAGIVIDRHHGDIANLLDGLSLLLNLLGDSCWCSLLKRSVEVLVALVPLGWSSLVWTTVLVELAISLHLLLLKSDWAHSPSSWIEIALHNATLDLGDDSVVASGELDGGHLSNTKSNSLTLGGHEDNLVVDLNTGLVAEETWNHELGTVADGVDGRVLDDNALVGGQKSLKWRDNAAEVALITGVVGHPLGVKNVVEGNHVLLLVHGSGADTAQLLHVCSHAQKKTKVDTEGTDVGSGLARNPEDTEVALVVELVKLGLVDGTDTELTLDGGNERWALEESTGEGLESAGELSLTTWELVMETDDANVLLAGTLLRLDETSGAVDTDDQAAGNLWIESSGVSSLLNSVISLVSDFCRVIPIAAVYART